MNRPAVSVLMPAYNAERTVSAAIASIQAQTFSDWELILVDDGSTDATSAIVAALGQHDPRIVQLGQKGSGVTTALNRGLVACRGDLIARLDADDTAHPDRLARQHAILASDDACVLVAGASIRQTGTRRQIRTLPATHEGITRLLRERNIIVHSAVMFRRTSVVELGGYRAAFPHAEDYDLWLRLAERGRIRSTSTPVVIQHELDTGVSRRHPLEQRFGAALARRAALLRRLSLVDHADAVSMPWTFSAVNPPPAPYTAEVHFFELLSRSALGRSEMTDLVRIARSLGRSERKLSADRLVLNAHAPGWLQALGTLGPSIAVSALLNRSRARRSFE